MLLVWLVIIPVLFGVLAWLAEGLSPRLPRAVSLLGLALELMLALVLCLEPAGGAQLGGGHAWLASVDVPWIPRFGIHFLLAADGLSAVMVALTALVGITAVLSTESEPPRRPGFFQFNLMAALAGSIGVFLALDLFLFFFFWEAMLIPMYLLIVIWGHENRYYSAVKFFIFTQASSLLMLAAMVGLAVVHANVSGSPSFDYFDLLSMPLGDTTAFWLMLGFFLAFAVKLPMVPFHTWLPDAHTDAPTAGSVVLAGILLKTGAYGMLRFLFPLFPEASAQFAPVALTLGVVGILYGALVAFAQDDFKRLVAYTSVSHMGFILLGVSAWNVMALQGVVMQMVAHALSTGALFMMAGSLQERLGHRDMRRMGGLWTPAPRLAAIGLFFAVASLGLPGMGNFIGEFLILAGTYQHSVWAAAVAVTGVVAAAVYALSLVQRSFHGPVPEEAAHCRNLSARETIAMGGLGALLLWIGLYPATITVLSEPAMHALRSFAG